MSLACPIFLAVVATPFLELIKMLNGNVTPKQLVEKEYIIENKSSMNAH